MLNATRLTIYALICCLFVNTATDLVIGAQAAKNLPARTVDRVVHVNPPGPNESRYLYVPFDVPARTVRISVSYQYDRAGGTNTIDIGLFDARSTGTDSDSRGFRGWSGGRRSEFFISRGEATPGYLRGEMPAGKWHIILGLYRVARAGVDVTFKIDIETENGPGNRPSRPSVTETFSITITEKAGAGPLPHQKVAGQRGRWWRGDLHMHTVHSDGEWIIPQLVLTAIETGLDFIVITDHNTASHHPEIDRLSKGLKRTLVMRGEEITTYGGHTNAWGLPSGKWIDFRTHPGDNARISDIASQVHKAGAILSINHPFALCGGCSWTYDAAARDFDAIEVWNGPWDLTDEPALQMWDKILQTGRRITAIASTDSHRPDTAIGKPATHVAAKVLSQAAVLEAIRQGRVYLTEKASGPVVNFEAELVTGKRRASLTIGDTFNLRTPQLIRFTIGTEAVPPDSTVSLISNGRVVNSFSAKADQPTVIEINCQQNSYFRLEIRDRTKAVLALTNPIYVRFRSSRPS